MAAHSPIRVYDDLSPGQTSVPKGTANDKTTGWIDKKTRVFI